MSVHAAVAHHLNVVQLPDQLRMRIVKALSTGWTSQQIVEVARTAAQQTAPLESFTNASEQFGQPPETATSPSGITLTEALEHANRNRSNAERTMIASMANRHPEAFCEAVESLLGKPINVAHLKSRVILNRARHGHIPSCETCGNSRHVEGPEIVDGNGETWPSVIECPDCKDEQ